MENNTEDRKYDQMATFVIDLYSDVSLKSENYRGTVSLANKPKAVKGKSTGAGPNASNKSQAVFQNASIAHKKLSYYNSEIPGRESLDSLLKKAIFSKAIPQKKSPTSNEFDKLRTESNILKNKLASLEMNNSDGTKTIEIQTIKKTLDTITEKLTKIANDNASNDNNSKNVKSRHDKALQIFKILLNNDQDSKLLYSKIVCKMAPDSYHAQQSKYVSQPKKSDSLNWKDDQPKTNDVYVPPQFKKNNDNDNHNNHKNYNNYNNHNNYDNHKNYDNHNNHNNHNNDKSYKSNNYNNNNKTYKSKDQNNNSQNDGVYVPPYARKKQDKPNNKFNNYEKHNESPKNSYVQSITITEHKQISGVWGKPAPKSIYEPQSNDIAPIISIKKTITATYINLNDDQPDDPNIDDINNDDQSDDLNNDDQSDDQSNDPNNDDQSNDPNNDDQSNDPTNDDQSNDPTNDDQSNDPNNDDQSNVPDAWELLLDD